MITLEEKKERRSPLFDNKFLTRLDRLSLLSKRVRSGSMKGERRSPRRGTSMQFADYRNYTPGDDLRQIDWNIYGRLEKLFLKLYEEEEDLAVHIVIDASASMNWSTPLRKGESADQHFSENKFVYARRVAAALAYITLAGFDRAGVTALVGEGSSVQSRFPLTRGKKQVWRLLRWLEELPAGGTVDLDTSLRRWALQAKQPGLFFFLSDLYGGGQSGPQEGLKAVQEAGFEVNIVHILTPSEVQPALSGDLKLIDVETLQSSDVTVDGRLLSDYQARFNAWRGGLEAFSQHRGINFIPVLTSDPFEDLILFYLRRKGVVR